MEVSSRKSVVKIGNLDFIKVSGSISKPAVILLHGYGASWEDLYPMYQDLDPDGDWNWYFPNAPIEVPLGMMMMGRAWFNIDMEQLQRAMATNEFRAFENSNPEGFSEACAMVEESVLEIITQHEKVILGGFSQGAMLCSHVGLKLKDKIESLVLLSANLINKGGMEELFSGNEGKCFFQSHGNQDPVLSLQGAKALYTILKVNGLNGEFHEFSGGHGIPWEVLTKLKSFLSNSK